LQNDENTTSQWKLYASNWMYSICFVYSKIKFLNTFLVGTFQIRGRALIRNVLDHAFAAGYRQIDTAAVYGNEQDIGTALKELLPKYNLKREDIFITSKLCE
jgi:diketogulonate reductase-like aldo/keto reductase